MASLNKALLIGRLGRDPELRTTQAGQAVTTMSLATDESYTAKDGQKVEKTEWHRIIVWGKQAEFCANYLTKGRLVYVEGKIETRKWQDKEGVERSTTEIKADLVRALDRKPDGNQGGQPKAAMDDENYGPHFPSEAGGMDDGPF